MVVNQEIPTPAFAGTKKLQELASKAFEVLRGRGMFMADDQPIRVPLDALTAFLEQQAGAKAADVAKAIAENREVFATEAVDDVDFVVTTRSGKAPTNVAAPNVHSFSARFLTPEPKVERPVRPAPERPRVDPNWATYSVPEFGDEDEDAYLDLPDEVEDDITVLVEPVAAEVAAPEATAEPVTEQLVEPAIVDEIVEPAAFDDVVEPAVVDEVAEPAYVEDVAEPAVIDEVTQPEVIEEVVAPAVAETAPGAQAAPVAPVVPVTPTAAVSDFSGVDDADLAAAVESRIANDPRIATFAGQWMAEDRVARLGRNDIRRIKEYISEQEQPLTDGTLAQDILGTRPNSQDFAAIQFAVNFRLSREHRDFDFVGTNDQRFWSTSSLPQIGTTRRKPNEIGTDYRYLVDEVPAGVAHRSVSSVSHVLSFYEFTLGLLPYDLDMQLLLPKQVLPDQRSAVLTFEIPQLYTTYLVELRYPTPNRGGFLLGLDDFYAESLVPGALISISATDNDGHYKVEFLPGPSKSARLLDLDDRRSPRYHFRPTSYTCEVSPGWLVSEERFPRLGSEKPLDDKVRRRPEAVVAATFERIGIEDGDTLISTFDELLTAVNIERPFSEALLRATLESDNKVSGDGADTFTYAAE